MMSKVPNYPKKGDSKRVKTNVNKEDYEDHKTTITNTSKNIYKPSFNLPAKESNNEPNEG